LYRLARINSGERGCLAGARARLAQDIDAGEGPGDDACLYGGGFEVGGPFERLQHDVGQAQVVKAAGGRRTRLGV
jgi:hypothetical protein